MHAFVVACLVLGAVYCDQMLKMGRFDGELRSAEWLCVSCKITLLNSHVEQGQRSAHCSVIAYIVRATCTFVTVTTCTCRVGQISIPLYLSSETHSMLWCAYVAVPCRR